MLLGEEAVRRLEESSAAVFGIGGVGSYAAEALARAGVGTLYLIDGDTVSRSNINRQLIALESTVGRAKAEVMAERIRDINPDCRVFPIAERYCAERREYFFSLRLGYIVDAIDSVSCKTDLIATALGRGVPIVSALGTGNRLDASGFVFADLSETHGCPLARVMRRELKKRGVQRLKVVYSAEAPRAPLAGTGEKGTAGRAAPASVSFVPGVAGMILAGEVIKDLAGLR